ncbi:hypothetical protein NQ318_015494 [Aromia moschata]|uniref:Protein hunchback n=1 Tax=Aromia moschata TaxID=1265417 RepID=A0AAV8XHS8_9CUCU|nr:hypothetical protein NQ318_015494 [Aromia moschata]
MVPFIRIMNGMEVDFVEVAYLKENPDAATVSDSDDAVCRLCLKRVRCVDLNDFSDNFAEDIIAKCIPEGDTKSTRDPKICLSCRTPLLNYYQFVTECSVKQENIMECDDQEAIKSEELVIKTEEEECDGVIRSEDTEIKSSVNSSYEQETNHTSVNWDPNQDGNEIKLEYPEDHKLIEDVAVTRYHCYHCPYVTNGRDFCLDTHMLTHKDISEITTYQCAIYPYKAKQKGYLIRHLLTHKDAAEVTTYDCSLCSYKAKRKSYLTQHLLTHKDISEVMTYQCTNCPYKAKFKRNLTQHLWIHKDASEVTTYDCSFCSYKAKQKRQFNQTHANPFPRHLLVHKDAFVLSTYQCKFCSFNTKTMEDLPKSNICGLTKIHPS